MRAPKKLLLKITRVISGWHMDGKSVDSDAVLQNIVRRVERMESVGGHWGSCFQCDGFFLKNEWLFFGDEKTCFDCFDWLIMNPGPEGNVNPKHLAHRLMALGVPMKDKTRFDHICEHVDCGDPGDDDHVDLKEICRKVLR